MRKVLYILGQLSDADAEWLTRAGTLVRINAGAELIAEGGQVDSMYILIEGSLQVHMSKLGKLAVLAPGEIVGELSLVDSRPASASVVAVVPSALLKISKVRLIEKTETDIGFGLRLYKAISVFLADRMRSTIERMGYGVDASSGGLSQEAHMEGEMDEAVLDQVFLAGARFDRIFKSLLNSAASSH